jgi:hypothetical protein
MTLEHVGVVDACRTAIGKFLGRKKTTYLSEPAAGEHLVTFGLTDSNAGPDVAVIQARRQ